MLTALLAQAASDPLTGVYKEFLSTGIVGAVAILFIVLWRQSLKREREKEKEWGERYETLWKQREEHVKNCAEEMQKISKQYHDELKSLTEDLLETMKEQSVGETKRDEVLRQVVTVQGSVERTLDRFLQRYGITRGDNPIVRASPPSPSSGRGGRRG